MPKPASKRALADAAYERAEDQRALVLVLAYATDQYEYLNRFQGMSEQDNVTRLGNALARVKAHLLAVSEPAKREPGELPGQLGIDGSIVGAGETTTVVSSNHVPVLCPRCDHDMMDGFGGSWTPVKAPFADPLVHELQCGECGYRLMVKRSVWESVRDERRRKVGASDVKPEKISREPKRTRGAG